MVEANGLLQIILKSGVFVKIPKGSIENTIRLATALLKGGVRIIEVDTRSSEGFRVIEESASQFEDQLIISADYVLDSHSARKAILAGAEIVSTPYLIKDILNTCNRYGKICIPGALTVTEVLKALEEGAGLIKLYPAELFGPGLLKAIKSPLPQANLIPSACVNLDSVAAWLQAGACAVVTDATFAKVAEDDSMNANEKVTMHASDIIKCFEDITASTQNRH